MTALYIVGAYLLGVVIFARLWYAFYPWKKFTKYGYTDGYQFWGEQVDQGQLRMISGGLALTWPVLLPVSLVWMLVFGMPWLGTRDERTEVRKAKREKAELEMREREARVLQMERDLGIKSVS